jgi:hypothetical protein
MLEDMRRNDTDACCKLGKMQPSEHRRRSGHSLVELMITVILVMILAAFAIPNVATAIATLKLRGPQRDRNPTALP